MERRADHGALGMEVAEQLADTGGEGDLVTEAERVVDRQLRLGVAHQQCFMQAAERHGDRPPAELDLGVTETVRREVRHDRLEGARIEHAATRHEFEPAHRHRSRRIGHQIRMVGEQRGVGHHEVRFVRLRVEAGLDGLFIAARTECPHLGLPLEHEWAPRRHRHLVDAVPHPPGHGEPGEIVGIAEVLDDAAQRLRDGQCAVHERRTVPLDRHGVGVAEEHDRIVRPPEAGTWHECQLELLDHRTAVVVGGKIGAHPSVEIPEPSLGGEPSLAELRHRSEVVAFDEGAQGVHIDRNRVGGVAWVHRRHQAVPVGEQLLGPAGVLVA